MGSVQVYMKRTVWIHNTKNPWLEASAFHPFTDYLVNQHHLLGFIKAEETNGPSELEGGHLHTRSINTPEHNGNALLLCRNATHNTMPRRTHHSRQHSVE